MKNLIDFIVEHSERGACQCGRCCDAQKNPEEKQPAGHTSDVVFFKVRLVGEPSKEELKSLISGHAGDYPEVNILDGKEHNYLEVGAWIGDQGMALTLMGMGDLLGLWRLFTPRSLGLPEELVSQMAGVGMVTIQSLVYGPQ